MADARELGDAVGASREVARCIARKYYSYALGYPERDADGSVLNALSESFETSGFDWRELVLDVVTHEAFFSVAAQPDLTSP